MKLLYPHTRLDGSKVCLSVRFTCTEDNTILLDTIVSEMGEDYYEYLTINDLEQIEAACLDHAINS